MENTELQYTANAGQTYMPFKENTKVQTLPYEKLDPPNPMLPPLELNEAAIEKEWKLGEQTQHFLPGVSAKMLDWFWANMEKGYYLWAPGSHKRFNWVREPWKVGFLQSAHMISESVGEGMAVFGGNGIQINRLDLSYFPFTYALEHVIVEGIFNDKGEFIDMTVHMWEDCEGGCKHITAAVASTTATQPPHFILEMLQENPDQIPVAPSETDHEEYEAYMWPKFLPTLYHLWENHPDPSQNVQCNLEVKMTENGPEYTHENGPVVW